MLYHALFRVKLLYDPAKKRYFSNRWSKIKKKYKIWKLEVLQFEQAQHFRNIGILAAGQMMLRSSPIRLQHLHPTSLRPASGSREQWDVSMDDNVGGTDTIFIIGDNGGIEKKEIKKRMLKSQLWTEFPTMKAAFLLNPNVLTTTTNRTEIVPCGESLLLFVKYKEKFRVGTVKTWKNIEAVELLLWKGNHLDFLKRKEWDNPKMWESVKLSNYLRSVDGGFVSQFIGDDRPGKNYDPVPTSPIILLSQSPDFCPMPKLKKTLVIYTKIPEDDTNLLRRVTEKNTISIPLETTNTTKDGKQ